MRSFGGPCGGAYAAAGGAEGGLFCGVYRPEGGGFGLVVTGSSAKNSVDAGLDRVGCPLSGDFIEWLDEGGVMPDIAIGGGGGRTRPALGSVYMLLLLGGGAGTCWAGAVTV